MSEERVTPSFYLSEFFKSESAARKGIDNTPKAMHLANIRNLLAPGMQRIRELLGHPVIISSGYRSQELNAEVGGSNNSQHRLGLAADFTCPGFGTPYEVARKILDHRHEIVFDQMIQEFGQWVHVSFSQNPRNEVLTAKRTSIGTVYSPGLIK